MEVVTTNQNRSLIDWDTLERVCGVFALLGLFWVVGAFYFSPDYGGVARAFYILMLLPAVVAAPVWLRRVQLNSFAWFIYLLPIIYLAVSVFWVGEGELNPKRNEWYFIKPAAFLFFLMVSVQVVVGRYRQVDQLLIKFIVVLALFTGILSLWSYLPTAIAENRWPRLGGISVNSDINVTASLYGVNIFFCAYGLVKWPSNWKWILLASLLVSLMVVFLTRSKVPLIFFFVVMLWLLFHGSAKTHLKFLVPVSVLLLTVFLGFGLYFDRVPFLDRAYSYSIRLELWSFSIQQARDHLFFGHGVGNFIKLQLNDKEFASHAHNFVIDTMRYGGLIGVLFLLAQISFIAWCCIQLLKKEESKLPIVAWFVMGVIFLLTNGQQPLIKPHHIWFFYWLPLCLILASNHTEKRSAI